MRRRQSSIAWSTRSDLRLTRPSARSMTSASKRRRSATSDLMSPSSCVSELVPEGPDLMLHSIAGTGFTGNSTPLGKLCTGRRAEAGEWLNHESGLVDPGVALVVAAGEPHAV